MIGSPSSSVYGPGPLDKFGIAEEPGTAVAGNVELGDHADAAIVRVGDQVANLGLRVEHAVGAHAGELGKHFALDAESLIVGQMPVQHVHLHGGHAVEIALEHVDGNEVAADVDQRAAPGEAGLIFDGDGGDGESGGRDLHELKKCLQAVKRAERGRARAALRRSR